MTERRMTEHCCSKRLSRPIVLVGTLLCLITLSTSAKQLYRYKNEQGYIVLDQSIPPEYVSKGYDILNDQGRVLEAVAPALTQKEIITRNKLREKEKRQLIAKQKQDLIDHELKQLYSHPNDAVRILKRRIQDIQDVTQVKKNKIESAHKQILQNETIAAERQRKGLMVPEHILSTIVQQKNIIIQSQNDIAELNTELKKVIHEFDIKIKRLEVITHHKASDYADLLQSINSAKNK